MHWKITALGGGRKVELRETARPVTPFGGLAVFFEFLGRIGYREAIREHIPFRLTSPNAIDPVETFTTFLLSVTAGARHTLRLVRADAGFFDQKLRKFLEQRELDYIVVARMTDWLKGETARVRGWRALDEQ